MTPPALLVPPGSHPAVGLIARLDPERGTARVWLGGGWASVAADFGPPGRVAGALDGFGPAFDGLRRHLAEAGSGAGQAWGYLHSLEVEPGRRSAGWGGLLVETVVGLLRGAGAGRVYLHARADAPGLLGRLLSFYARHGFDPVAGVGDVDPVLCRRLDAPP